MNTVCPDCGFRFVRESGYFLGAIVISYFVGVFSIIPTVVLTLFLWRLELPSVIAIVAIQLMILHPFLYHGSKLAWLRLEKGITRKLDG